MVQWRFQELCTLFDKDDSFTKKAKHIKDGEEMFQLSRIIQQHEKSVEKVTWIETLHEGMLRIMVQSLKKERHELMLQLALTKHSKIWAIILEQVADQSIH